MSSQIIRILIAGALFVHGIGHTLGLWKPPDKLLFAKASQEQLKIAGGTIWIISAAGFVLAAMGFFGLLVPAGAWRPLAIIFAVISLLGLILFGRKWPVFNFMGASAMNIAVLVALLWLNWPPFELFGR